jgi:hypothetical protein
LIFVVDNVDGWQVDERIITFGEFWTGLGLDDLTRTQVVMGKLQGPRSFTGLPTPPPPSAGFVTLSRGSYYKHIFNASIGDSVGFVYAATSLVDVTWQELAASKLHVRSDNSMPSTAGGESTRLADGRGGAPNSLGDGGRGGAPTSLSDGGGWYWSDGNSNETNTDLYIARTKALGCSTLMLTGIVDGSSWTINRTSYPSGVKKTADRIRKAGLKVGLHTLPYPPSTCTGACADTNLLQEGLAPTYRSGSIGKSHAHVWYWTEDLGVWWGHEGTGNVAQNGNPAHNQYGYECPQLVTYNCSQWGANMTLFGAVRGF